MSDQAQSDPRRRLASVSALLDLPRVQELVAAYSRPQVLDALRETLDAARAGLAADAEPPDADMLAEMAAGRLERLELQRLRPVVNATGIVLHTGLGRAPLPVRAARALADMHRCCNLQIDLETGLRGARNAESERLLCRLTGAEAAMLVNNNAAATMLILAALCPGREVVVSRGQLIEIGGSYRLPDCITSAGAKMVEVGTTNKTHLRDYENALGDSTGALLHVNPSNYRIVGFTESPTIEELVSLKKKRDVLVIDDLGCGALIDLRKLGLPHEPTAPDSIRAGADICCFSGDKLIGGPQAGIIVGGKKLIKKIKKHPLTRMLRVGKMTDLALQETLKLFLEPMEVLVAENPTLRMISMSADEVKKRARRLAARLEKNPKLKARVFEGASEVGGGSLPGTPLPTWLIGLRREGMSADQLSRALRLAEPPIIARIENEEVLLDLRTVLEEEETLITQINL
ncbi:MAG: L-seryl-tRNA(Sec) selenium transferase [Candidatus Sumerlaeia bacterium]